MLATKGISLDFVRNSDGSIRGVTFTDSKRKLTFAGSKIDRSLSFANIDKHMFCVMQFDDRQDEDPLQLRQQQEKPFGINEAFDFSQNSDKLRHPSKDGTAEQQTIPSDGSSSGSSIGEAIVDVLLQPNVAPVSSGGGGGASGGWRDDDDDDEKNKHSYKPRKRR